MQVKYLGRDPASGSMRLSRKVLLSTPSQLVTNFVSPRNINRTEKKTNSIEENTNSIQENTNPSEIKS